MEIIGESASVMDCESGVALRFPPHSKFAPLACRARRELFTLFCSTNVEKFVGTLEPGANNHIIP